MSGTDRPGRSGPAAPEIVTVMHISCPWTSTATGISIISSSTRRWDSARRLSEPFAACNGRGPKEAWAICNSRWLEAVNSKRSARSPAPLDRQIERLLGPPQGARVWVSATPFVPPRFLKRRGANTLLGQINAELASRGLPSADELEELPRSAETLPLRHYVRCRQHGGTKPPIDVGYAIRLGFSEPITGPLTLGYASHFGLGIFYADTAGDHAMS